MSASASDSTAAEANTTSAAYKELCDTILPITMVPKVDGSVYFQKGKSGNPRNAKNPSLAFYRAYVANSLPVVMLNCVDDWAALTKWANKGEATNTATPNSAGHHPAFRKKGVGLDGNYVAQAMRQQPQEGTDGRDDGTTEGEEADPTVTVALTPNGWADALTYLEVEQKDEEVQREAASSNIGNNSKIKNFNEDNPSSSVDGDEEGGKGPEVIEAMLGPAEVKWTLPRLMSHLKKQHASKAHLKLDKRYGRSHRRFVSVGKATAAQPRPVRSDDDDDDDEEEEEEEDEDDEVNVGDGVENQRRVKEVNENDVAYPLKAPIIDQSAAANDESNVTAIAYAQFQNNSLETQFPAMQKDIGDQVKEFGSEVFGCDCDAANMWIGGDATVTSMHQDWYENLYVVVAGGVKTFHLVPPWEAPLLDKRDVKEGTWMLVDDTEKDEEEEENDGQDEKPSSSSRHVNPQSDAAMTGGEGTPVGGGKRKATPQVFQAVVNQSEDLEERVPWVVKDVTDPIDFPESDPQRPHVLTVDVSPGEVFYLPAMWFHRVSHKTYLRDTDTSPLSGRQAQKEDERRSAENENPREGPEDLKNKERPHEDLSCVPGVMAVNYWFDMNWDNPLVATQEYFKQTQGDMKNRGRNEMSNFLKPTFV